MGRLGPAWLGSAEPLGFAWLGPTRPGPPRLGLGMVGLGFAWLLPTPPPNFFGQSPEGPPPNVNDLFIQHYTPNKTHLRWNRIKK